MVLKQARKSNAYAFFLLEVILKLSSEASVYTGLLYWVASVFHELLILEKRLAFNWKLHIGT